MTIALIAYHTCFLADYTPLVMAYLTSAIL
jgi:hypothetical protein